MSTLISMSINSKVEETRKNVWHMFDRIAHRYDLLNRLLSLRQDVVWRNKLAHFLPNKKNLSVLDVATGTGDALISLKNKSNKITRAIGIDMAEKMLEQGRIKLKKLNLENSILLQKGDATDIHLPADSFDVVTIAFGIRNVNDLDQALKSMFRVLNKNGRVLILEFSLPVNPLLKSLYLFYFRKILPKIGGALSGDSYAYNYLNETVESFPYGENFTKILQQAGFSNVQYHPLSFGIATIYQGDK